MRDTQVLLAAIVAIRYEDAGREETIVIYCARGNRSALAADTLQQMGYENVSSMADGFGAWIAIGGPVED